MSHKIRSCALKASFSKLPLRAGELLPPAAGLAAKRCPSMGGGTDPLLNYCQGRETGIAASQFWIQPCKPQLCQHLLQTKPFQKS